VSAPVDGPAAEPRDPADLAARLDAAGYLADEGIATAAFLAVRLGRPLFVEGFRFHDIHRHRLPLLPAPGTEFPIKGGTYGNTTCLPLPDVERFNNPSISG
jgi:hypothetical protein